MTLEELENEIEKLKERNKKVEGNKAWETSWSRKVLLFIFTYLAIGLYINAIGIERPWLNAVIPSFGFLLSTLTLPYFKSLWEKYIYKK